MESRRSGVLVDEAIYLDVEGFHEHGFCKCSSNVSLYYALFGCGPIKVVLLMGMPRNESFSAIYLQHLRHCNLWSCLEKSGMS